MFNNMCSIRSKVAAFLLCIIALIPSISIANGTRGWIYESAYPTSNTLLGVKFVTPSKGWAVGTFGTIVYTEDGGINWELQESNVKVDLKAVSFVNEKTGWIAGNGGTILHTENGGKNWTLQGDVRINNHLHKVFFLNESEGWVGGDEGVLFYTRDGGKIWEKRDVGTTWPIAGIFFKNKKSGWVLAGGQVFRTTNGGKVWSATRLPIPKLQKTGFMERFTPDEEYSWWGGLHFLNEKKGWAVIDRSYVFRTEDGGSTWKLSGDMQYTVTNIAFSDEKNGCVGGSSIFCTEDGGKTWKERLGIKYPDRKIIESFLICIQGLSFANRKEGWAVGGTGDANVNDGHIMKTEDGGKNWRMISRNDYTPYFIDSKVGWTIQNDHNLQKGKIVKTEDGGKTWKTQKQFENTVFIRFYFANATTGWAIGEQTRDSQNGTEMIDYFILHTDDGGKKWVTQYKERAGKKDKITDGLFAIHFINSEVGWIGGSRGRILHTKDGGNHWESLKSGTKLDICEIQFVDEKVGWIAASKVSENRSSAVVFHTDNGGNDWKPLWKKQTDWVWLMGMRFLDAGTGWGAIGINEYSGDCLLIHTTDGGKTWSETVLKGIYPSGLYFLDKDRGMILTQRNHIYVTHDGGKTWGAEIKPIRKFPWHISEVFK